MSPITHALLPAIAAKRWLAHAKDVPRPSHFLLVALSGALPDILSPRKS